MKNVLRTRDREVQNGLQGFLRKSESEYFYFEDKKCGCRFPQNINYSFKNTQENSRLTLELEFVRVLKKWGSF